MMSYTFNYFIFSHIILSGYIKISLLTNIYPTIICQCMVYSVQDSNVGLVNIYTYLLYVYVYIKSERQICIFILQLIMNRWHYCLKANIRVINSLLLCSNIIIIYSVPKFMQCIW